MAVIVVATSVDGMLGEIASLHAIDGHGSWAEGEVAGSVVENSRYV